VNENKKNQEQPAFRVAKHWAVRSEPVFQTLNYSSCDRFAAFQLFSEDNNHVVCTCILASGKLILSAKRSRANTSG